MSEQIDIAVDLGAVPRPLPEIVTLRNFVVDPPKAPPQIIQGILHQGCKMILGGTAKSNKSWCLLDLAISVASGERLSVTGELRGSRVCGGLVGKWD